MSTDAMMLLIGIVVVGWVLAQLSGYAGRKSREDEKMWERWMDEM